jgi:hypothetical protein
MFEMSCEKKMPIYPMHLFFCYLFHLGWVYLTAPCLADNLCEECGHGGRVENDPVRRRGSAMAGDVLVTDTS